MTYSVKVENGVVVDRAVGNPGEGWIEHDEAQIGWSYDGKAFAPPPAPEPPPSLPVRLTPYRIVRRIEEAGKLAQAQAVLDSNLAFKWRFTTAPDIAVNDPDLVAGVQAIGLDPAVILRPDLGDG